MTEIPAALHRNAARPETVVAASSETEPSNPVLVRADGVTKLFRSHGHLVRAVDDVSLEIRRGTTLGVVGESGSGKSTLARCILYLLRPDQGAVTIDGVQLSSLSAADLRRIRRRLQVVFQDPHGSLNRRLTVAEIVAAPLAAHRVGDKVTRKARVGDLLDLVGLSPAMASRRPRELSGGQAQRVAIARALALEPEFVVLDEAVSALDVSVRAQIMNLLRRLQDELRLTYLFITHDLSVARYMSHEVAVMYGGRFVETGPRAVLFEEPVHPYTRSLMAAVPVADPFRRLSPAQLPVVVEDPSAGLPSGCRFHPRCPVGHGLEECTHVEPEPTLFGARHIARCHHPQDGKLPQRSGTTSPSSGDLSSGSAAGGNSAAGSAPLSGLEKGASG